jgi:hypothetical protein
MSGTGQELITIEDKVQIIMRQTSYSENECREKLEKYAYDEILVIKDYFGIANKKQAPIKSVNQEIYKQLRGRLNSAISDYQTRVETKK